VVPSAEFAFERLCVWVCGCVFVGMSARTTARPFRDTPHGRRIQRAAIDHRILDTETRGLVDDVGCEHRASRCQDRLRLLRGGPERGGWTEQRRRRLVVAPRLQPVRLVGWRCRCRCLCRRVTAVSVRSIAFDIYRCFDEQERPENQTHRFLSGTRGRRCRNEQLPRDRVAVLGTVLRFRYVYTNAF